MQWQGVTYLIIIIIMVIINFRLSVLKHDAL